MMKNYKWLLATLVMCLLHIGTASAQKVAVRYHEQYVSGFGWLQYEISEFADGTAHGVTKINYSDGTPYAEMTYDKGVHTYAKIFYGDGSVNYEGAISMVNNTEFYSTFKLYEFNNNGTRVLSHEYTAALKSGALEPVVQNYVQYDINRSSVVYKLQTNGNVVTVEAFNGRKKEYQIELNTANKTVDFVIMPSYFKASPDSYTISDVQRLMHQQGASTQQAVYDLYNSDKVKKYPRYFYDDEDLTSIVGLHWDYTFSDHTSRLFPPFYDDVDVEKLERRVFDKTLDRPDYTAFIPVAGLLEIDYLDDINTFIYTGEFSSEGLAHGKGQATNLKGIALKGTFAKGSLVDGEITWSESNKIYHRLSGKFQNNKLSGRGQAFKEGEYTYVGEFKNGLYHGKGQLKMADGNMYDGQFLEGEFDKGYCSMVTFQGNVYEGSIVNGLYDGKGKIVYPNGDSYQGSFSKGEYHGYGEYKQNIRT